MALSYLKKKQQEEINGSMGIIYLKERWPYLNLFLCLLSASLIKESTTAFETFNLSIQCTQDKQAGILANAIAFKSL